MRKVIYSILLSISWVLSYAQNRGYEKSIEIKGAIGFDDRTDYAFGLSMVNGYRFNDYVYLT